MADRPPPPRRAPVLVAVVVALAALAPAGGHLATATVAAAVASPAHAAVADHRASSQRFTDVTAPAGINVAGLGNASSWVDYDRDGVPDLFVTNSDFPGRVDLYRGRGDGSFRDVTTKAGLGGRMLRSVSWGDYDGDGWVDSAATTYAQGARPDLFRNRGDGTFEEVGAAAGLRTANLTWRAVFEDYDLDGDLDLYVANWGPNQLYRNRGDGTFSEVAAKAGVADGGSSMDATWADFDRDGLPDLFVADEGADRLYRNRGDGTFADVTKRAGVSDPDRSESACWGDYDGDGRLDLYVVDIGAPSNHLCRGDGHGSFADVTATAGVGDVGDGRTCSWVDVDGDGRLDLFAADHVHVSRLFRNRGQGRFTDVAPRLGLALPFDVFNGAWGDFDGDGDPDLFEVGHDGNVLLRNDGPPGAYVRLRLTGTVSNTTGIGATASARIGGVHMSRRVDGASGAYGQDSPVLEFGVGAAPGPFTFSVVWPSGIVQEESGVMPSQLVEVVEPHGPGGEERTAATGADSMGT